MSHARKWYNAARARIDGELPHQVALPDDMCTRDNLPIIEQFCARTFGGSVPTRRVTAVWDDRRQELYRLHCFATRDAADLFALHFEGQHFDPKTDREKGKVEGVWRRKGAWIRIDRCGPLELPDFWRRNP